jgi:hypothetical protein
MAVGSSLALRLPPPLPPLLPVPFPLLPLPPRHFIRAAEYMMSAYGVDVGVNIGVDIGRSSRERVSVGEWCQ